MKSQSPVDTSQHCHHWLERARAAWETHQADEALHCAEQAELCAGSLEPPSPELAEAALLQAEAAWALGRHALTFGAAMRASSHYRALKRVGPLVTMLHLAALSASVVGLPEDALPLAMEAVELASSAGQDDPELLPKALGTLAHVHARLGHFEQAESLHLQALSRARETGEGHALLRAYTNALLAGALAFDELNRRQETQAAQALAQRQLKLAFQLRPRLDAGFCNLHQRVVMRVNLALTLMNAGRLGEAGHLLQEAEQLLQAQRHPALATVLRHSQAELARRQGHWEQAQQLIEPLLAPDGLAATPYLQLQVLRTALSLQQARGDAQRSELLRKRLEQFEDEEARQRAQSADELRALQRRITQALQQSP